MKEEEKNHETTGKKTTLTDKIYQDIKDDILTKVFQPGEKLNIKELAREYQVSDTPVKQALQRLAEEKLVVNTPNKGMSVRALTPHELQDIFDMRLMMDTFFVKDIVTTLNYNHVLLGGLGQMLHQGGFAASRPAFDEKHLHPGLPAQRLKITLEARRCGGPQKEIGGTALDRFHIRTPHFCFRVCKNEGR